MYKKILKNKVVEKIIIGNDMTLYDLCDELGYRPQQHENFVIMDGYIKEFSNGKYRRIKLKRLLECIDFKFHVELYINKLILGQL